MAGRWYGVRGRRFMRPTLALTRGDGSPEVRALADLAGKPWAAFEGSEWVAEFAVEMTLEEAASVELSVSPDITIELTREGGGAIGSGERVLASGAPSAPLAKSAPGRRRPAILASADPDRVTARLAAAGDALQRERDRRSAAERTLEAERERRSAAERGLEEERAEGRRLQLELGQLRAELELARTHESQASDSATELESVRQELLAAQRQVEELTRERDRAARAHAETRTALNERTGALESARQALAAEQAETSRLRSESERRVSAPPRRRAPAPEPPDDEFDADGEPDPPDESLGRRITAVVRGADAPASHPAAHAPSHAPHAPAGGVASPWFGRALALLFLIAVIVAIVLVVNSTVA